MAFPESAYIHKSVSFRYRGKDLTFSLSQALFSSNDIDAGTRLLLKTLAGIEIPPGGKVLDTGCGTGIIGCCLKKHDPGIQVVFQDRDALALAFTEYNADENGLKGEVLSGDLLLQGIGGETLDLIVSNLPAKAGPPVLADFFLRIPALLSPGGKAAVVIVDNLSPLAREGILKAGCEILSEEKTARHSVYIFRPASYPGEAPIPGIGPYIRREGTYLLSGREYPLTTAYGLPDFDTPGYTAVLAAKMLSGIVSTGSFLFFNPGQGHLPASLLIRGNTGESRIFLAGRDILSLTITAHNLERLHFRSGIIHIPSIGRLRDRGEVKNLDALAAFPDFLPAAKEHEEILLTAAEIIKPDGLLFVAGSAGNMAKFERSHAPFRVIDTRKHHGCRGILFRRP